MNGPDVNLENRPEQIELALARGYDCEIDLWIVNSEFYLGHDRPDYPVKPKFLENYGLWIHAKNLAALRWLTDSNSLWYFWHEEDQFTLTSNKFIWTYPGGELTQRSIVVLPELFDPEFENLPTNCFGICTDYIEKIVSK